MSTLSAFPFIGEQSFATPGAFNSPLSIISANIAAINTDVGAISGVTISPPSGNTIQMPSDVSISGYLSVGKGVSIGTQAPSIAEPVALTIGVNSGVSDYLYLNDVSNLRSDYLIGSHAGGTADGLNIFDVSGNTMIVGFSKQSVRFYVPVVGNAFDQGGAVFNLLAYGAIPDDSTDASPALLALLTAMPASGGDILINGQFALASTVTVQQSIRFLGTGIGSKWRRGVNSDITGSGSQLRYSGSSGDMLAFRASSTTPQLHVALENLTLVGNARVSGSTRGSVLRFYAPDSTLAINPRLIGVHVQESSGDGITFDGNVFEGGTFDCVVSQCSESGISAQANNGGAPGELAFIRTTLSLNSVGLHIAGGGDFSYTQLSASNNAQAGVVANGVHLSGTGLNMESNGSVYFRGLSLARSFLGGININYTGSTGSSNATAIYLDQNCIATTIIGIASNGTAAATDVVIAPGAQATLIVGTYAAGFAQRVNDQGFLTQIIYGSQLSNPALALDGSTLTAAFGFSSERSLGWYRSGASSIGLTYGQIQVPAGTALAPGYAFSSESSLGFYRSAGSTIVQSYGTFGFSTFSQIGTGVNRIAHTGAFRTGLIGSNVFLDLGTLIVRDGNGDTATGGAIQVFSGTAATPTYTYTSETTLGLYRSGVATIAQSQGTFNLATNAVRLSMRTLAASSVTASAANTNVATNEVVFTIGGASGASLCISSGGTTYIFSSALSARNT